MAKIEKLPSGKYRTRVYDKSTKKQRCFTADTKAELKQKVARYTVSSEEKLEVTVKDAVESYITNRSEVLSPSTVRNYRQIQRTSFDSINHYYINKISSEDIQRFVNDFSKDHSPKTTRNAYGLLISSIKALNPNYQANITLPQKEVVKRHIPTDEDIKNLINESSGYMKIAILLASVGTLRRGEICALTYEDIQGNTIHVHSDIVIGPNGQELKPIPKTSASDRYVELPKEIIDLIGTGEGRIVNVHPNVVTKHFMQLRDKLGIECRFHDLRHYAASIMHAIGVPDVYIMERGGWSSDTILKSVYRNVLDDKRNEFTNKTNNYLKDTLRIN